ncbi:hypothetical protein NPIL_661831 [Nephila pilipes]|uniref:Uncharacterized protein n=1 Tax=Nephila pilipes TaxID=299642 RepID=A0A8X6QWI8_NEPPI|nr:hypothetical protein NPIL_661831 [Nephila pilipes]
MASNASVAGWYNTMASARSFLHFSNAAVKSSDYKMGVRTFIELFDTSCVLSACGINRCLSGGSLLCLEKTGGPLAFMANVDKQSIVEKEICPNYWLRDCSNNKWPLNILRSPRSRVNRRRLRDRSDEISISMDFRSWSSVSIDEVCPAAAMILSAISVSFSSWSFEIANSCTWVGKHYRKRDFSKSFEILFPVLLLISSKRHEGLRSLSCIPEKR